MATERELMLDRIAAIIPAYEPKPSIIVPLVKRLLDTGFSKIIVVNDGSVTPDALVAFHQLESLKAVDILTHAVNLGKGAALKTALNHGLVKWTTLHGFVTLDADGQHALDDVLAVARHFLAKPDMLLIGGRHFGPDTPFRS